MVQKKRSVRHSQSPPNWVTQVFGGIVGKIVNVGQADTVNVFTYGRWLTGLLVLFMLFFAGVEAYRSFVPQSVTVKNLPKETLIINNVPLLRLDSKLSQEERQKAQALVPKYQQQVQQNPNDTIARTNLGEAMRRSGDLDGAEREQQKALALDPNLQAAKIGIALVQKDKGHLEAAQQLLQQVTSIQDQGKGENTQRSINFELLSAAYAYLGDALLDAENFKAAEVAYRKAISLHPEQAELHALLAIVLEHQDKYEETMTELRAYTRLKPDGSAANIARAMIVLLLVLERKPEEAIPEAREALRFDPNSSIPELHHALGNALSMQRKTDEAIAEWKIAKTLYEKEGNTQKVKVINRALLNKEKN